MKAMNVSVVAVLLVSIQAGSAQGFSNLNFEAANVSGYTPGSLVPASSALPGWTAVSPPNVLYDTISLGAAAVSIHDINDPGSPPLQGLFSVLLQGADHTTGTATIAQTGQVPGNAETLTFWGQLGSLQITFKGQLLPYSAIGSGANYTVYGADISAFAGQLGELRFSAAPNTGGYFDNIQFSNLPVPEPGVFGLSALGALLLGWRVLWRR